MMRRAVVSVVASRLRRCDWMAAEVDRLLCLTEFLTECQTERQMERRLLQFLMQFPNRVAVFRANRAIPATRPFLVYNKTLANDITIKKRRMYQSTGRSRVHRHHQSWGQRSRRHHHSVAYKEKQRKQ